MPDRARRNRSAETDGRGAFPERRSSGVARPTLPTALRCFRLKRRELSAGAGRGGGSAPSSLRLCLSVSTWIPLCSIFVLIFRPMSTRGGWRRTEGFREISFATGVSLGLPGRAAVSAGRRDGVVGLQPPARSAAQSQRLEVAFSEPERLERDPRHRRPLPRSQGSCDRNATLAHTNPNRVEIAYARTDHFEKRRALMKAWAEHCLRDPGTLARVVPLLPAARPSPLFAENVPLHRCR